MSKRSGFKPFLKGIIFFASLLGLGVLFQALHLGEYLTTHWMDQEIRGRGGLGVLIFLGMAGLFTGAGLPRQIVSFLGGYVFGALFGSLLALLGTVLGCLLSFSYARLFGRGVIQGRYGRRIEKFDRFLQQNPFSMTLFIRVIPVGSNLLTCLLAGVSSVPALPFLAGSAVGYLPQTLIFALLGSGFKVDPFWRISVSVILFLLTIWWGLVIYRRHRLEQVVNGEQNQA
jgi:uncharacterized membrane protein YdjX (TVP38/TMEM64 family)